MFLNCVHFEGLVLVMGLEFPFRVSFQCLVFGLRVLVLVLGLPILTSGSRVWFSVLGFW